jgi:hypothetical protein
MAGNTIIKPLTVAVTVESDGGVQQDYVLQDPRGACFHPEYAMSSTLSS